MGMQWETPGPIDCVTPIMGGPSASATFKCLLVHLHQAPQKGLPSGEIQTLIVRHTDLKNIKCVSIEFYTYQCWVLGKQIFTM